jgi:hypothetical protein
MALDKFQIAKALPKNFGMVYVTQYRYSYPVEQCILEGISIMLQSETECWV